MCARWNQHWQHFIDAHSYLCFQHSWTVHFFFSNNKTAQPATSHCAHCQTNKERNQARLRRVQNRRSVRSFHRRNARNFPRHEQTSDRVRPNERSGRKGKAVPHTQQHCSLREEPVFPNDLPRGICALQRVRRSCSARPAHRQKRPFFQSRLRLSCLRNTESCWTGFRRAGQQTFSRKTVGCGRRQPGRGSGSCTREQQELPFRRDPHSQEAGCGDCAQKLDFGLLPTESDSACFDRHRLFGSRQQPARESVGRGTVDGRETVALRQEKGQHWQVRLSFRRTTMFRK